MANSGEDWQLCAKWLVRCQVLPADHRIVHFPNAEVFELAQILRDGVLICHLLNTLKAGSVDMKDFSQRPQMSQFLCLKNIRSFLMTCRNKFGLDDDDLFDPYDLFEVRDFGKVIHTLSCLSQSDAAKFSHIEGFISSTNRPGQHSNNNQDYYNNLSDLADGTELLDGDEDIYGSLADTDQNEDIYGEIMYARGAIRRSSQPGPSSPGLSTGPTRRDYCIRELVETEGNYVNALQMIVNSFIHPLQKCELLTHTDHNTIFLHIEHLHKVHSHFYTDLHKACSSTSDQSARISTCFIEHRPKLLVYGEYCSNLTHAQEQVDVVCARDPRIADKIKDCQMSANNNKFQLRDLLAVPMQRILKYSLLMKELIKVTEGKQDKDHLNRALEAMQDLSLYVNEVKRDNEHLQLINEIQNSIQDLKMPPKTALQDYGRLLKDGELKIKSHEDSRAKPKDRYVFLFDRVMMMCKSRGEQYNYKNALILNAYKLDHQNKPASGSNKAKPWTYTFTLYDKDGRSTAHTFIAKTEETKQKWIEAINMALENTDPYGANQGEHQFVMYSFDAPTICDVCGKLLRGVFFQGYQCNNTKKKVHKECIAKLREAKKLGKCKALYTYRGNPPPDAHRTPLMFESGDVIELLSDSHHTWYRGRLAGREGFFPSSHVTRLAKSAGLPGYEHGPFNGTGANARSPHHHAHHTHSMHGDGAVGGVGMVNGGEPPNPPPRRDRSSSMQEFDYTHYPWFSEAMSRPTANVFMENFPNGTFLIRDSVQRKGEHALSIKHNNEVKHIRVVKNDNMYCIAQSKMFHSLPELVEYYQANSLEPSFPALQTPLLTPYKLVLPEGPEIIGYCTAMFDYTANQTNQISFKQGDTIAITSKAGGFRGWWKGKLKDKSGYFPSAYVVEESER